MNRSLSISKCIALVVLVGLVLYSLVGSTSAQTVTTGDISLVR